MALIQLGAFSACRSNTNHTAFWIGMVKRFLNGAVSRDL
jgi:hypothetical protein